MTQAPIYLARLTTDEARARRIANLLGECLDPADAAAAAFAAPNARWQVDAHFRNRPDLAGLRALIAAASDEATAQTVTLQTIRPRDWVKQSLAALQPVTAGRFVVHGAHDRARVPANRIGIEIEAAQAFGTGHHGTTRGCLMALDLLLRRRRPRHILDLGTGTGVLAIAAARALQRPVLASDIDLASVRIARDNARHNRAGHQVATMRARGLAGREIGLRAPFDLVLANILLLPLLSLAAPIARSLMPRACVVLSGLLRSQANAAIAAYRQQGLVLARRIEIEGWVTLVMEAASHAR